MAETLTQAEIDELMSRCWDTEWFYVVGDRFCCGVGVTGEIIVYAAPILRRFIGQPLANLIAWGPVPEVRPLV